MVNETWFYLSDFDVGVQKHIWFRILHKTQKKLLEKIKLTLKWTTFITHKHTQRKDNPDCERKELTMHVTEKSTQNRTRIYKSVTRENLEISMPQERASHNQ